MGPLMIILGSPTRIRGRQHNYWVSNENLRLSKDTSMGVFNEKGSPIVFQWWWFLPRLGNVGWSNFSFSHFDIPCAPDNELISLHCAWYRWLTIDKHRHSANSSHETLIPNGTRVHVVHILQGLQVFFLTFLHSLPAVLLSTLNFY